MGLLDFMKKKTEPDAAQAAPEPPPAPKGLLKPKIEANPAHPLGREIKKRRDAIKEAEEY